LRISGAGGPVEAKGQQVMADSIPVVLASNQSSIPIDTELPAAAALTDNFANPTAPAVGAFNMVWDGATWDRMPGAAATGVLCNIGTSITLTVDSELPAAAALADNTANPTVPGVGAFNMVWDGTTWDRCPGSSTSGMTVSVSNASLAVTTELPNAVALADNTANPTVPGVGSFGMLWDGAAWDRAPGTAADGMLVNLGTNNDVTVTELTPTTPVSEYVTSADVAAGATASLTTAERGGKKLKKVTVWSTVAYRAFIYTVDNAVESTNPIAILGGRAFEKTEYEPPHKDYHVLGVTAGLDAFRVKFINLDQNAADAHAQFYTEG